MLQEIISSLGENYRNDEVYLQHLIDAVTTIALTVSNRKNNEENIELLRPYIEECVIGDYLSRGGEGLNSLSEGGVSSNLKDNRAVMRERIISAGLRRCY